jgi:hypothetical protein
MVASERQETALPVDILARCGTFFPFFLRWRFGCQWILYVYLVSLYKPRTVCSTHSQSVISFLSNFASTCRNKGALPYAAITFSIQQWGVMGCVIEQGLNDATRIE